MIELSPVWQLPPKKPAHPGQAIHLWLAPLDVADARYSHWAALLSPDERQRADQFVFDQHRARFTTGRAILRSILGQYLQRDPAMIRFEYNLQGKPSLLSDTGQVAIHFNLSHSDDLALFAFSGAGPLGVDIEWVRPQTDIEQTGALVFCEAEWAAVRSAPPDQRRKIFFQFWTRKEALIKAAGGGFSIPLDAFDVSQAPEKPLVFPVTPDNAVQLARWHIQDIALSEACVAALACKSSQWPVSFFMLPDPHLL